MVEIKETWSDSDFENMGWHDCRLYDLAFPDENFELKLDIDYIFEWLKDNKGDVSGFLVSPCELVFENVSAFKVDVDFNDSMFLFIENIMRFNERLTPNKKMTMWDFKIECEHGYISFSATGFKQKIMKPPVRSETQDIKRV
ncbi:hypothetical protein [Aliikangiella sp. G2MR2-5]|uniref:hypothetical protein n=1 Tax=Aliikangiella sp. G2MR2-5 TaxID=2788943 RepID=UPI0018A8BFFF|nr:hypothetical protein [Aliikangiella sp. G2MR2-5]